MDGFETALKRAFAEAPEPVDAGFTARVAGVVARREQTAKSFALTRTVGFAAAGATLAYGLVALAQVIGPDLMSMVGLELARANSALSQSSLTSAFSAVGLTQMMMIAGALMGGAVVYRTSQD